MAAPKVVRRVTSAQVTVPPWPAGVEIRTWGSPDAEALAREAAGIAASILMASDGAVMCRAWQDGTSWRSEVRAGVERDGAGVQEAARGASRYLAGRGVELEEPATRE